MPKKPSKNLVGIFLGRSVKVNVEAKSGGN